MRRVKVSLRLNNDVEPRTFIKIAAEAEAAGFDELWVSHDLFLRAAPALLAAVAQHTRTIGLGAGVLNPYSMHPAELAMAAATLQELCGGRFRLGLAAGAREFLGWAGIVRDRPLARVREAVVAVRALLSGGRPSDVDGAGPGWQAGGYLRMPAAPVPVYLGAMSPKMLSLAGEVADGVLPLLFPPEHFPVALSQISSGAARAAREIADIDVAACIWCSVDDDPARAREALARKVAYYGPSFAPYLLHRAGLSTEDFDPIREALGRRDLERATTRVTPQMLALGVAGSPTEILQRCRTLIALGAAHISFGPPLGPDLLPAVRLLGTAVLPALRATPSGR